MIVETKSMPSKTIATSLSLQISLTIKTGMVLLYSEARYNTFLLHTNVHY